MAGNNHVHCLTFPSGVFRNWCDSLRRRSNFGCVVPSVRKALFLAQLTVLSVFVGGIVPHVVAVTVSIIIEIFTGHPP